MHQSGFHSFHGGSDRIYIVLDMCQSLCLRFFFDGRELVILRWPLSWFLNWSRSSRLLLTRSHHPLHKCNLDLVGGCGITHLGPPSSAKLLSRGTTIEYNNVSMMIFEDD